MTDTFNASNDMGEVAEVKPEAAKVEELKVEEKPVEVAEQEEKKEEEKQIVTTTNKAEVEDSLETEQVVVFKLEKEEYAAPILEVQEIIPTGAITPFPNVPDYIAGIINVRGTVATVVNLGKRFSLTRENAETTDKYIILTKTKKALFGIMVDEVTSVMKIPTNKIKSANGVGESKIHTDYIKGVAVVDERIILILDFLRILDEEAIASVADQAGDIAN